MLENLYTTKMSGDAKVLQKRFSKIRSKQSRKSKIMAIVCAAALMASSFCATVVMAAVDNQGKNFTINSKSYAITPVLIENSLATHTDNYYVPLRETFKALGYETHYDVDKSKYQHLIGDYTFPAYDYKYYKEFYDNGEKFVIDYNGYEWQKNLITNDIDYYIYGATERMNAQMPIIEMTKNDVTEYCQIGSRDYSKGYSPAPVIINNQAYIPLRAVAYYVGGDDNVKWNPDAHDTYFDGALKFDEAAMTIDITIE